MAKAPVFIRFTYEDYKTLPEGKRYEIIDGDLMMVPSPDTEHQDIIGSLFSLLREHVLKRRLGKVYLAPLDVVMGDMDKEDVVQPDIFYISHANRRIIRHEAIYGAPDLVVEVISPSSTQRDRNTKKKLYARHGVREYWIVDSQSQTVEVFERKAKSFERVGFYGAHQTLHSVILPDLKISLADLF